LDYEENIERKINAVKRISKEIKWNILVKL
jgi:hypothetical protein